MENNIDTSKATARSAEFSAGRPLPPIGTSNDQSSGTGNDQEDDARSNASSAAFDNPGEGKARPRIVRGFRPEALSDEEMEKEQQVGRSVSFSNGPPVTSKRRTYDGREITFVTLNTQTDWDWVQEVEITGTARTIGETGSVGGKEKGETSPRSASSKPEASEDKATPDVSQFNMPYNDEYGIPILDLSSDTDDKNKKEVKVKRDDETPKAKLEKKSEDKSEINPEEKSSKKSQPKPKLDKNTEEILSKKSQPKTKLEINAEEKSSKKTLPKLKVEKIPEEKASKKNLPKAKLETVPEEKSSNIKLPKTAGKKNESSSDDEVSHRKVKDDRTFMPSVGPPNILQYQRESEKQDITVEDPEARVEGPDFEKDESGVTHGMFSGNCEFCANPIKPFPTVEQQLKYPPEILYCCNDYREFVEFVLSTSKEMEEEEKKKNKMIDIKPHEHVGSKQERNAAKEKAVQRMRERELQRRQQEASGMQQNFFASGPGGAFKGFMKIPGGLGNLTMKDMYGNTPAVASARAPVAHGGNISTSGGSPRRFLESGGAFARQMKTINYQLSSQKCLEEGWTLRAPSPLMEDEGDDVFIPEPLHPEMLADGKYDLAQAYRPDSEMYRRHLRDRPLIEKFYENGKKFLTMFPDGTGNVFYPSGNLAILLSSVKLGQYNYTIHQDFNRSGVAAAFEPNGLGYCYFPNGDIRLYIDQYGGIELDNYGARRRKWSWKDQVTHVHAPPFQPICIGVNRHMGIRVMSQDNIALTFSASKRSCRFNMGSRLKLVAPENAPLKEVEEENIFLEEKKNHVDALLNKVANLLKFPNNPKLEKMLPPLHVTSKQIKTEKMKKDRQIYLAQQSAREKKQPSITVNS